MYLNFIVIMQAMPSDRLLKTGEPVKPFIELRPSLSLSCNSRSLPKDSDHYVLLIVIPEIQPGILIAKINVHKIQTHLLYSSVW